MSSFPNQRFRHRATLLPIMQPSVFLTGALYAALAASQTEAHGYISQPLAKFVPNVVYTTYNGIITADSYPAFAGKQFARSPEQNAQVFTECFKASEFKTLKAMLDPAVSNCGNTRTDVDPVDVTSMQTMNWQNNEYKQGFLDSHHVRWAGNWMVFNLGTDFIISCLCL